MSRRTILSSVSNSAAARVLASSVLPTPVGPRNRKDPTGRRGALIPDRARVTAPATTNTPQHRLVLPHDPLVQDLVQAEQFLPLALFQAADGDAGPAGHDLRDLLLG